VLPVLEAVAGWQGVEPGEGGEAAETPANLTPATPARQSFSIQRQSLKQMNKFFLFYSYDYYEMGGIGFEEFSTKQEALQFINEKLLRIKEEVPLSAWQLIEGRELSLKAVERITEITA
jgi:hypothetical protein